MQFVNGMSNSNRVQMRTHRTKFTSHQFWSIVVSVWITSTLLLNTVNAQEFYPPLFFDKRPLPGSTEPPGNTKVLVCEAAANPRAQYKWLKDGLILVNKTESTLRISLIQRPDVGEYQCIASNTEGAIISEKAFVHVAYLEPFADTTTRTVSVSQGQAAKFDLPPIDCYPTGHCSVDWYEGQSTSALIAKASNHYITLKNSLVLLQTQNSDNAKTFRAKVQNSFIQISYSLSFSLTVVADNDAGSDILPKIIVPPVDTTTVTGEVRTALECVANARPLSSLSIKWFHVTASARTEIVFKLHKYTLSRYKRLLTIQNPSNADSGAYQCEAVFARTNNPQVTVSANANITVHSKPVLNQPPSPTLTSDYGSSKDISCKTLGNPTPQVTWYFNTATIDLTDPRFSVMGDSSLHITSLVSADAGMYQCFSRNDAGEITAISWLQINSSPPMIQTPPRNLSVIEAQDARFPCRATGAPEPVITWSELAADGQLKPVSGMRFQKLEDGTLLISSTQQSDSGTYVCNATNSQGSVAAQGHLLVSLRTQIIQPPQNVSVMKGRSTTLQCSVSHDPSIQVKWEWYHSNLPNVPEQKIVYSDRIYLTSEGGLHIIAVRNSDIGQYKCQVTSTGGNDNRTATLKVIELPYQPVITSVTIDPASLKSVIVEWQPGFDGNSPILRFILQYRVVPPGVNLLPEESWQSVEDEIGTDTTSYTVTGLMPARHYEFRVSAQSVVGEGTASLPQPNPPLIMPQQPPSSPPRGFYGTARSNTSIMLQWQPPVESAWNGPLLGYIIFYKLAGYLDDGALYRNITNYVITSHELVGLIWFTEYEIRIAAYNAEGVGAYTPGINVWTHEGHPTTAPLNVVTEALNSTSVKVSWDSCDPQQINGVNLGYKIFALNSLGETQISVPPTTDWKNRQIGYLMGLEKYTDYKVTVACYTTPGNGPRSSPPNDVKTMEDVPGIVGSLIFPEVLDRTISALWTPPPKVNGILLGYTLIYQRKNVTSSRTEVPLAPAILSYTIQGLSSTTMYSIELFARTAVGPGPSRSADIESGVPPELPTSPYNLGVTNIEARSVLLQFLPGFDGKTSITNWIVEGLEGGSTEWTKVYEESRPDATDLVVQNLHPYTEYRLRMIAINVAGRSHPPSLPSRSFQTKQAAPSSPPGNVTARALNETAIRISWTPLLINDWNGVPQGYMLYYRMKSTDATAGDPFIGIRLENGMSMDSYVLARLQEWMEYEVKMTSYNEVDNSIYSPVTVERTREAVPSSGPQQVAAVANSSTSIAVSWGAVPQLEQNGMILGYKIKYESMQEGIPAAFATILGNDTQSHVIQNLRKYVQYEIQVLASTSMGDGVLSQPVISVTTFEDVPGQPLIIYFPNVTYTMARIVWDPPVEPNGILTGYMVSYRLMEAMLNTTELVNLEVSTREYTATKLKREKYYEFGVTARTRLGWGDTALVKVYTMHNRMPPDSCSKPSISISEIHARTVPINWQPGFDGYGPLRNYTIQFQSGNGNWQTVQETVNPELTSYTITGLKPNTFYKFRVSATNDIGTSPFSEASNEIQTLQDKPEGPPLNVKAVPLTTNSIRVTWNHPVDSTWNGNLEGAIVQFRQSSMPNFQEQRVAYPTQQIDLDTLTMFVTYEVQILAYNAIGQGPHSKPTSIYVGEAAPTGAPINVVTQPQSSTELHVTWDAPPSDTQNGVLSGYKVLYWPSANMTSSYEPIIVRENEVTLQNLEVYTQYAISLLAYNLAGEGPRSPIAYDRTMEGIPGIPREIRFIGLTLTSLNISWIPPLKPNGVIINYEITYYQYEASSRAKRVESKRVQVTVPGSQMYYIVKDLLEETKYLFSVSTMTTVGVGAPLIANITTGPQEGSPGAPSQPVLEEHETLVKLVWINGDEGNSPISAYLIQSLETAAIAWQTILQKRTPESEVEVSYANLKPEVQYRFRVIPMNMVGVGTPSPASETINTPEPVTSQTNIDKPFFSQWWFLVIMALAGLVLILLIISCLCLIGRNGRKKKHATVPSITMERAEEDGGFSTIEMRQSRRGLSLSRNGTLKRDPPRPSPGSVLYSEDESKGGSIHDDDDSSSLTEKPSQYGDSSGPSEAGSDPESDYDQPPPPFTNHYVNDSIRQSWKQNYHPHPNVGNAYSYTDSEQESSHYAFSLNGGHMVMNNNAGSRAPLPGFSSFV